MTDAPVPREDDGGPVARDGRAADGDLDRVLVDPGQRRQHLRPQRGQRLLPLLGHLQSSIVSLIDLSWAGRINCHHFVSSWLNWSITYLGIL